MKNPAIEVLALALGMAVTSYTFAYTIMSFINGAGSMVQFAILMGVLLAPVFLTMVLVNLEDRGE